MVFFAAQHEELTGTPTADEAPAPKKKSNGVREHDNVCRMCNEPGELLCCEGSCYGAFHAACIGLARMPEGARKTRGP